MPSSPATPTGDGTEMTTETDRLLVLKAQNEATIRRLREKLQALRKKYNIKEKRSGPVRA